jgi:hypothetical protein
MNEQIKELEKISNEIKEMKIKIIELMTETETVERELKQSEYCLMESITNENDPSGKPIFKNADQRNTEMNKRLSENETHLEQKKLVSINKSKIQHLNIEIEYLLRQFSILKMIIQINYQW